MKSIMRSFGIPVCCFGVLLLSIGTAKAASIEQCQPEDERVDGDYYMTLTTTSAATCLDSGFGEPSLTGGSNDSFLTGVFNTALDESSKYEFIGKNDDGSSAGFGGIQFDTTASGDWAFSESLWDSYSDLAIGFKFGGGNGKNIDSDTWFVYQLAASDYSGTFSYSESKGLSHVNLYARNPVSVPEPGTIGLLGLGIIGLLTLRRRPQSN